MDYRRLTSIEALDAAFTESQEKTVVLFKHSLTCPVSTAALREYERFLESEPAIGATLIEIQPNRPVSNEVATRTGVRHESPQALVLRDGKVAWHASHWDITAASLAGAVDG
ncbi:MAG: bacillithiol system redox-active protein YtxJ [Acidobacteriota bacterium]